MKTESYSRITTLIRLSFCYSVKLDNMELQVTGKNSVIDRSHLYFHCIKLFLQSTIKLFRLIIRTPLSSETRQRFPLPLLQI